MSGIDLRLGHAGNDAIYLPPGQGRVEALDGHDTIHGGYFVDAGAGNDRIYQATEVVAGDGDDLIVQAQVIDAGAGNDTIHGGQTISGGDGHDIIYLNGPAAVDGGNDTDVVHVSGARADYTLTDHGDGRYTLTDNRPDSPDGTITLFAVEALQFSDTRLPLRSALPDAVVIDHQVQLARDSQVTLSFFTIPLTQPAHGTLAQVDGQWQYTPEPGFTGIDTFIYVDNAGVERTVQLSVGLMANGQILNLGGGDYTDIAALPDGALVTSWTAGGRAYLRRVEASGTLQYGRVTVDSTSNTLSRVIVAPDGRVMVLALDGPHTYSRVYNAQMQSVRGWNRLLINTGHRPRATFMADNSLVALNGNARTLTHFDTQYQSVNQYSISGEAIRHADLRRLTDNSLLLSWQAGDAIVMQRFDEQLRPVGSRQTVSQLAVGDAAGLDQIAVTPLISGGWVIAWTLPQTADSPDDVSGHSIRARQFAPDGSPLTAPFTVNQYTADGQQQPSLTHRQDGGWSVAWWSTSGDDSGFAAFIRHYRADGSPLTGEQLLTGNTLNNQYRPVLTTLNDGRIAASLNYNNSSLGIAFPSVGTMGDDVFLATQGNNVFNGLSGLDTVIFGSVGADFSISDNTDGSLTVEDIRSNSPQGSNRLYSIEFPLFTDD